MSESSWQDQLPGVVRVMQIIVLALIIGCLTFAVIAIALKTGDVPADGPAAAQAGSPFLTYIALAAIVPMLIAFIVVRGALSGQTRRVVMGLADKLSGNSSDLRSQELLQSSEIVRTLLQAFQSRLIVGAALFEGATFFLLVCYLVEGNPIALGAAFALVVGIALQFPTPSKVAGWIEQQIDAIHHQRQFSR